MDDELHTGTGVFFIGIAAGSQTEFTARPFSPAISLVTVPCFAFNPVIYEVYTPIRPHGQAGSGQVLKKNLPVGNLDELVKSHPCHPEPVEGCMEVIDIRSCFDRLSMTRMVKFNFLRDRQPVRMMKWSRNGFGAP